MDRQYFERIIKRFEKYYERDKKEQFGWFKPIDSHVLHKNNFILVELKKPMKLLIGNKFKFVKYITQIFMTCSWYCVNESECVDAQKQIEEFRTNWEKEVETKQIFSFTTEKYNDRTSLVPYLHIERGLDLTMINMILESLDALEVEDANGEGCNTCGYGATQVLTNEKRFIEEIK